MKPDRTHQARVLAFFCAGSAFVFNDKSGARIDLGNKLSFSSTHRRSALLLWSPPVAPNSADAAHTIAEASLAASQTASALCMDSLVMLCSASGVVSAQLVRKLLRLRIDDRS